MMESVITYDSSHRKVGREWLSCLQVRVPRIQSRQGMVDKDVWCSEHGRVSRVSRTPREAVRVDLLKSKQYLTSTPKSGTKMNPKGHSTAKVFSTVGPHDQSI